MAISRRAQGAFEYILLLAGVLLIVVMAVIILRGTLLPSAKGAIESNANTANSLNCLPTYLSDPNVVGWWKLDEGSGAIAADSSGKGNHGAATSTGWTAGLLRGGFSMAGGATVSVPESPSLDLTQDLTLEAYINRAIGIGSYVYKLSSYRMFTSGPGVLQFTGASSTASSGIVIENDVWTHVAAVYHSGTHLTDFYVNGVAVATGVSGAANPLVTANNLNMQSGGGHSVDNVVVYSRALSAEEIRRDYSCGQNAYA